MVGNFENIGSFIRNCNGIKLKYDQACLEIVTNETISFWSQYEECEDCMLLETEKIPFTKAIVLNTISPLHYAIRNRNGQICNGMYSFIKILVSLLLHYDCNSGPVI